MLLALALALQLADAPAPTLRAAAPAQPVVTLAEAMARARTTSPLVAAARARLEAADLARTMVPGIPNPLLELRGENYGPVSSTRLPRDVFATIAQPVELGGKRRARIDVAGTLGDQAATALGVAEWVVALDVAESYIDALRARAVVQSLDEQHQGVHGIVEVLARRVREGTSAEADLRKFETERTLLASQIARASIALQSAVLRLSASIGLAVDANRLAVPGVGVEHLPIAPPAAADVASRADVRTAAAVVRQAEAQLALERSRAVPDVTVTAGYKRTSGFDTGVAAITMPVPLFDRNRPAVARAGGELRAAQLDLEMTERRALADATTQWAAARLLAERAGRSRDDLVEPAAVVRTAARSAFAEGSGDLLQLVDAERVFGQASREAAELALDTALAVIHARIAAGLSPLP